MTHRIFIIDPATGDPCAMIQQEFSTHWRAKAAMAFLISDEVYEGDVQWCVAQEGTARFASMKADLDIVTVMREAARAWRVRSDDGRFVA